VAGCMQPGTGTRYAFGLLTIFVVPSSMLAHIQLFEPANARNYLRPRDERKRKEVQNRLLPLVAINVRDHVTRRIWLKDV
jgi:hypothetical protein